MDEMHSCRYAGTCRYVLAARADADAAHRQLSLIEKGRDLLAAILMDNPLPEEIEHAEAKRACNSVGMPGMGGKRGGIA